jgi:pseudaminic acid cytidylyltransferase
MANPEFAMTRSQDLSDKYFDAGQFYLYNKSALYNKNDAETLCTAVILDSLHSIDIDTEEDLQMAEAIMNIHKPFLS